MRRLVGRLKNRNEENPNRAERTGQQDNN
jgi:hypothetical protein